MKILVVSYDFPPDIGGIAVFVHNLCLQLCRLGHQVDVLSVIDNDRKEESLIFDKNQPYRVYRYNSKIRPASILPFAGILSLYLKNRYDLLFMGHFFTTTAIGIWFINKMFRIPYVILSHGNDFWRASRRYLLDRFLSNIILGNANLLLANSKYTAQRFGQSGYAKKIGILTPGVDDRVFNPQAGDKSVLKRYGIDDNIIILVVARLVPKKNLENIVRSMMLIKDRGFNAVCLIVGEGEERKNLEKLRDSLGLSSDVVFVGRIEHNLLPGIFCASDIFLQPSLEVDGDVETFGITFLEASACSIPVIGSISGGIKEAVIDGQTGILVNPGNVEAIAGAVISLLENSDLRKKMGKNGLKLIKENFTWEKIGDNLNGYLTSCCNYSNTKNEKNRTSMNN